MAVSMLLMALAFSTAELIDKVMANYNAVQSYQVTLRTRSDVSNDVIRYYYKKPGLVRMEFIRPHEGAVLVYDPSKKAVKLRPFGSIKNIVLTLSPDNYLVKSPKGHRADESDIGVLIKTVKALHDKGIGEIMGEVDVGDRDSVILKVTGTGNFTVKGIHAYLLWIDKKTFLPVKASSFDVKGALIEEVVMDDLEIDMELGDALFDL